MKKLVFGSRTAAPAYFDMGARFKPASAGWYGGAFRMGDRCAAHVWLADWRHKNPNRRLVVIEDSIMPGTEASRHLDGVWLFKDIADELWQVEKLDEKIPCPGGETLYHVTMWRIWRWLMTNRTFTPTIRPKPENLARMQVLLKELHVPDKFITVQPLFDAAYDTFRNGSVAYWSMVVQKMAMNGLPVVILGDRKNSGSFDPPNGTIPLWKHDLDPMDSLSVISKAEIHVGGATGTTLWAPVLQTRTLAVYKFWGPHPGKLTDTRPMSFGKQLVYSCLDAPPDDVAFKATHMFNGSLLTSTPMG